MAKHEVIVVSCDKCGFEERDMSKFAHVTVTTVVNLNDTKTKPKVLSSRDLCESCIGLPGVNREN